MPPSSSNAARLPAELWLVIVDHLIADHTRPERWSDLARFAWTCRAAYSLARCPLWQHLTLVFRIDKEKELQVDPDATPQARYIRTRQIESHAQVLESSVFPCYRQGQLAVASERFQRIRQVSKQYAHLQPFVVLDGQLYLASMVENERNPSAPDLSGLASLWDDDSLQVESSVRVVGGLVLVPYPLRWVTSLTIDALASAGDIGILRINAPTFAEELPFLFSMDPNQIITLRFLSDSGQGTSDIYNDLCGHFSGIRNHDFFLLGGEHYCPSFGPQTSCVKLFHDRYFDSDEDVFVTLSETPVATFEQYGVGCFDMRFFADKLMISASLTRLVLDYDLDSWGVQLEPFRMHLPALQQLTVTFEVAEMMFDEDLRNIMFPLLDMSQNRNAAFPSLTHLTLLDVGPDQAKARPADELARIPWVPYHHMPRLTHFSVPLGHRGIYNYQFMLPVDLQTLTSHTRIQSFAALGLKHVMVAGPPPAQDVSAPHLAHIEASTLALSRPLFVQPRQLVSAKVAFDVYAGNVALFDSTPKLTHLHMEGREFYWEWFSVLARQVPQLAHLVVVDHEDADETGSQFDILTHCDPAQLPLLPNLEFLSFSMTHGSFDMIGLALPRLKHLVVDTEHPHSFPAVYPQLESLRLTGALCPRHVIRLLELVPSHCRVTLRPPAIELDPNVQLCNVVQLRMRFAGVDNRHVWHALLKGATSFPCDQGLIKESVTVVLDRPSEQVVQDGDAQLIAQTLAKLLGKQTPASIPCFVVVDEAQGDPPSAQEKAVGGQIVQAIADLGITAFSVVEFR